MFKPLPDNFLSSNNILFNVLIYFSSCLVNLLNPVLFANYFSVFLSLFSYSISLLKSLILPSLMSYKKLARSLK